MTQIKLQGKEYNLAYNMLVAITYERITGNSSLELDQFNNGKVENILMLGFAMITCNNQTDMELDTFLQMLGDIEAVNVVIAGATAELASFFRRDKMQQEEPQQEDAPKNV